MDRKRQTVNFLTEIIKFREWRGNHRISTGQAALFSELQMQFNLHRFQEWFPVSISKLHDYTSMSNRAIYDARNVLKQKGLIDFKKGTNDTRMAMYKVMLFDPGSFYANKTAGHSAGQSADQTAGHSAGQSATNKTIKQKTENNTVCMSNAPAREEPHIVIPMPDLGGGRR